MLRHRPRLLLAVALAAALASVGLAGQTERGAGANGAALVAAETASGAAVRVGDRVDLRRLHRITRPGLYGMSHPPTGSRYGIVNGNLIRYDPRNVRVLSIIRLLDRIVD